VPPVSNRNPNMPDQYCVESRGTAGYVSVSFNSKRDRKDFQLDGVPGAGEGLKSSFPGAS